MTPQSLMSKTEDAQTQTPLTDAGEDTMQPYVQYSTGNGQNLVYSHLSNIDLLASTAYLFLCSCCWIYIRYT